MSNLAQMAGNSAKKEPTITDSLVDSRSRLHDVTVRLSNLRERAGVFQQSVADKVSPATASPESNQTAAVASDIRNQLDRICGIIVDLERIA